VELKICKRRSKRFVGRGWHRRECCLYDGSREGEIEENSMVSIRPAVESDEASVYDLVTSLMEVSLDRESFHDVFIQNFTSTWVYSNT